MKFELFDADDLKAVEDTLTRAMVRAMRIVAREGLLRPDWRPPPPVSAVEIETKRRQREEEETRKAEEQGRRIREEAEARERDMGEVIAPSMPAAVPSVEAPAAVPSEAKLPEADVKAEVRVTENDVRRALAVTPREAPVYETAPENDKWWHSFKVIPNRPEGYIPTDEARELITGLSETSASATLSTWIHKDEVPAVIVINAKPPTRGMPGRLHVNMQAVIERDKLRQQNSRR